MTVRQTRTILWAAAGGLVAASAAVWTMAALMPCGLDDTAVGPGESAGALQRARDTAIPPLSAFQPVWSLPLRRPLFDPPPVIPPPVKKPPLPVRLTGTATDDPKTSCGFFLIQGRLVMAAAGETIRVGDSSVEILKIAPGFAVVRWCGDELTLKPEPQERPGRE